MNAARSEPRRQSATNPADTGTPESSPKSSRLIVVETVVHRRNTAGPVGVSFSSCRLLETDEQSYTRELRVGEEWVPIDLGWLQERVSVVVVENLGEDPPATIPNEEEKARRESRVLEIGCRILLSDSAAPPVKAAILPIYEILPGDSHRGRPVPEASFFLRCLNGETRCKIFAVPV